MSIVQQFLTELEGEDFPLTSAREIMVKLGPMMKSEEKGRAATLIARLEARAAERNRIVKGILDVVPDGFLRAYMQFTQVTESPDTFHLFSIVSVLSHVVGRKAWFSMGVRPLFPAFSAFLVSPAGQARRSSAIRLAVEVGRAAGACVVQDQMTPEGLASVLTTTPTAMVVADEAATLLTKREYMADMPALLCTLLDCPDAYQRTLKGQVLTVANPTVNALFGCAPDWIANALPKTALGGGLFSRMIVVYEASRKRLIALPDDEVDGRLMQEMKRELGLRLREIQETDFGQLSYDKEAKDMFRQFYVDNDRRMGDASERMAIYYSRKPDHVHRLAVLMHCARSDREETISEDTLARTLTLLSVIEPGMELVYRQAGLEKPGQLQQRVISALQRAKDKKLSRSDLLRKVSDVMDAKQLSQVTATLKDVGEIECRYEVAASSKLVPYYVLIGR